MSKLSRPPRATVRTIGRWQDTNDVVLVIDAEGKTHRFTLDDHALHFLAEQIPVQRWLAAGNLRVVMRQPVLTNVHSDTSLGTLSRDGSPTEGQKL